MGVRGASTYLCLPFPLVHAVCGNTTTGTFYRRSRSNSIMGVGVVGGIVLGKEGTIYIVV